MFCKTCNSDLNVFRGKVSYDFSKGRKIAKYTCDEGFIIKFDDDNEFVNKRVNSYVRTCMKFGGWHQKEPKCARKFHFYKKKKINYKKFSKAGFSISFYFVLYVQAFLVGFPVTFSRVESLEPPISTKMS